MQHTSRSADGLAAARSRTSHNGDSDAHIHGNDLVHLAHLALTPAAVVSRGLRPGSAQLAIWTHELFHGDLLFATRRDVRLSTNSIPYYKLYLHI